MTVPGRLFLVCILAIALISLSACGKSGGDQSAANSDERAAVASEPESEQRPEGDKEDEEAAEERAGVMGMEKAKKTLPPKLAGYKLKGVKEKKKSEEWIEYSATYKGEGGKIKVVINEHLPGIRPEWTKLMKEVEEGDLDGQAAGYEKKGDKQTYMVIVEPRYRVDIKSREVSRDDLKAVAEAFDYKEVQRIGR